MLDDRSMARAGEPGELVVRGPGVTPGYWNDLQTTAARRGARRAAAPAAIITLAAGSILDEGTVVGHCEAVLSDYKVR